MSSKKWIFFKKISYSNITFIPSSYVLIISTSFIIRSSHRYFGFPFSPVDFLEVERLLSHTRPYGFTTSWTYCVSSHQKFVVFRYSSPNFLGPRSSELAVSYTHLDVYKRQRSTDCKTVKRKFQ